eukprot:NODE_151_length_15465_cov_0.405376.p7 type:complete len:282 gc:universal NODE_151_length_15465_cov_0.405376:9745-10590(+)
MLYACYFAVMLRDSLPFQMASLRLKELVNVKYPNLVQQIDSKYDAAPEDDRIKLESQLSVAMKELESDLVIKTIGQDVMSTVIDFADANKNELYGYAKWVTRENHNLQYFKFVANEYIASVRADAENAENIQKVTWRRSTHIHARDLRHEFQEFAMHGTTVYLITGLLEHIVTFIDSVRALVGAEAERPTDIFLMISSSISLAFLLIMVFGTTQGLDIQKPLRKSLPGETPQFVLAWRMVKEILRRIGIIREDLVAPPFDIENRIAAIAATQNEKNEKIGK